jgi:hypothetical protein
MAAPALSIGYLNVALLLASTRNNRAALEFVAIFANMPEIRAAAGLLLV